MTRYFRFDVAAAAAGKRKVGWGIVETGAAGWTIAAIRDLMRNQPRNWPGLVLPAVADGDPSIPEAASVDGDDAGACLVADGGGVERLPSPAPHSRWSAILAGWDNPSIGSAAGRRPDGLGELGAAEPPSVAVQMG